MYIYYKQSDRIHRNHPKHSNFENRCFRYKIEWRSYHDHHHQTITIIIVIPMFWSQSVPLVGWYYSASDLNLFVIAIIIVIIIK